MKPFPKYLEVRGYAFHHFYESTSDVNLYFCPQIGVSICVEKSDKGYKVISNRERLFVGDLAKVISERKFKKLNKDFL